MVHKTREQRWFILVKGEKYAGRVKRAQTACVSHVPNNLAFYNNALVFIRKKIKN